MLTDATDNQSCLKYSQQGLRTSFQCQKCIAQRLLSILNGRIQTFLKEMVKIYRIKNNKKKKAIYEDYKEMYSISLRVNETSTTFPKDLYDTIERLKKIYEKNISD
ncbi:unnamed protein product [Rotaria sordida]|uniref:Uncharacterized protein n=1 Tax=Rotaria sordida TaxID=392033 RepID=A0A815NDH1_9BILA|nr:unnamed protein product [Rotaria sordida]CAF1482490.1 unnamed protein product [Rotaria sordida]CAF3768656.1 unnamed protein product [Rotaria sordida]